MEKETLDRKISGIHAQIKSHVGNIGRIGIALYNRDSGMLSTFVHSTDGLTPLEHYEARLDDVQSLKELHEKHQSRIIDDLSVLEGSPSEHTRRILSAGYKSSYTCPLYANDELLGFLFFDSPEPAYFRQAINIQLDTYARLIGALISNDLSPAQALRGAVAMAREFGRHRDDETHAHVTRVAAYSRLIARELVATTGMSDEDIEFLYQFAGLHDIGKIALPDSILLKPGKLTDEEYAIARSHVVKGVEMIEVMVREFSLHNEHRLDMLRNIVACHHERHDGRGYPAGLSGDAIPVEGRIVAVADVFDALTTSRPYKKPWPFAQGLQYLGENAGTQFDPACVEAMLRRKDEVAAIHNRCRG